jgi:hypothetical protein
MSKSRAIARSFCLWFSLGLFASSSPAATVSYNFFGVWDTYETYGEYFSPSTLFPAQVIGVDTFSGTFTYDDGTSDTGSNLPNSAVYGPTGMINVSFGGSSFYNTPTPAFQYIQSQGGTNWPFDIARTFAPR